jgi:hypothetical protein
MYPNPDKSSIPVGRPTISSLPANIKLETIQEELYKQGFATIPTSLTNTAQIYIPPQNSSINSTEPPAPPSSPYPKEEHPKKKKASMCSIQ